MATMAGGGVARVEQFDGFRVVEIGGEPYARGRQHGVALRPEIRTLRDRLYRDIIFRRGRAVGAGFSGVLYAILTRMHPFIPRELRAEMQGVADGAGVAYRDILLVNCFDDVLHTLGRIGPLVAPIVQHRFVAQVIERANMRRQPATRAATADGAATHEVVGHRAVAHGAVAHGEVAHGEVAHGAVATGAVATESATRGAFACSSFVLTGDRSAAGGPIHGRNLDYAVHDDFIDPDNIVPTTLRETLTVFVVRPERGEPFAAVGWPGFVGLVTAMNGAGISLACMTSTVARETPNGTPLLLLYRLVAQYARSLDEAEWLLRGAKRTIGNNLSVASGREDDGRLFEFTPRRIATVRPRDGLLRATNHFQHPWTSEEQAGWVVGSSESRWQRLGELFGAGAAAEATAGAGGGTVVDAAEAGDIAASAFLAETGATAASAIAARAIDADAARAALVDTCRIAGAQSDWDCLQNPGTVYGTVAEPARLALSVRAHDRPDRAWVELDLSDALRPLRENAVA